MFQLSYVAGPRVLHHCLECGRIERLHRAPVSRSITCKEVRPQQSDVLASFTQRRNPDLDGIQAEKKIFAELSRLACCRKVCVGGRKHAYVHSARAGGTHSLDLARFKNAQELGLLAKRNVADFIQKKGAAVSKLEPADAVGARVCECALDMAKQFALKHSIRNCARIH